MYFLNTRGDDKMIDSEKLRKIAEMLIDGCALVDVAKIYSEQQGYTPLEVTLDYAQKCLCGAQEYLSEID